MTLVERGVSRGGRGGLRSLVVVTCLLASAPALAHKLNVFAVVEGDKIAIDGYFVDGKKALNSTVKIYDPKGKAVVSGTADAEGHFETPIPGRFDLKIVVDAGMGHRGEWVIPAAELGSGSVPAELKPVAAATPAAAQVAASSTAPVNAQPVAVPAAASATNLAPASAAAPIDPALLRQIVDTSVAESIRPLVRALEESSQKDKLTQLIGSVGYIFGVFGLWAYFKSRQSAAIKEKPDNVR